MIQMRNAVNCRDAMDLATGNGYARGPVSDLLRTAEMQKAGASFGSESVDMSIYPDCYCNL